MTSMKKKLTMKYLVNFLKKNFAIDKISKKIQDQRKKRQISTDTIFKSVLYTTMVGRGKAFLQMDQILREPALAKLVSKDTRVPSDTTIIRVAELMDTKSIREVGYHLFNKYVTNSEFDAKIKLPSGRRCMLGVVDGTEQTKKMYSVFGLVSKFGISLIDMERYSNRGKELVAGRCLMNRLYSELGFGFVDILVLDNLYATQNFLNHSLIHNVNCVVKLSKEKNYVVAREAEQLFSGAYDPQKRKINHISSYVDDKRKKEYEIFSVSGLHFNNVIKPVKLLKVIEKKIGADTENCEPYTFYILSTDETLSELDLLEIFHLRWRIENNGFKASNANMDTKRASSKNEIVTLNVLLIKFFALFLLKLYYYSNDIVSVIKNYRHNVKVTFATYFVTLMCSSIIEVT